MRACALEITIPHKLGDTSEDYARWRAEVLAIRDMPEYKLKKLWKANFSPKDIAANRHWEMFPPPQPIKKRIAPGIRQEDKRGRRISEKKKAWVYARALKQAAEALLAFYRMESAMLAETRKEMEHFTALMKKYDHKSKET